MWKKLPKLRLFASTITKVEMAVQAYRRRRHKVSVLVQIEEKILSLWSKGLSPVDDDRLWKTEVDGFKACFSSNRRGSSRDITFF